MEHLEQIGWIWIDVNSAEHLDKGQTYRIGIGNEHWNLRYGGLHEWFCSKVVGEHEVPANALIEAGCPIFMRRQPVRWEGIAKLRYEGNRLILSDLDGPTIPSELDRMVISVKLSEVFEDSVAIEPDVVGDEIWARS
jgi:hypothetical protein